MTVVEKAGLYLSIFTIIVLLALIVFSKNGVLDYNEIQHQKDIEQNQLNDFILKNQKLEKEIISLKTDMNYIKHIAKHEHDMAEEGELIFRYKSANRGNLQ